MTMSLVLDSCWFNEVLQSDHLIISCLCVAVHLCWFYLLVISFSTFMRKRENQKRMYKAGDQVVLKKEVITHKLIHLIDGLSG